MDTEGKKKGKISTMGVQIVKGTDSVSAYTDVIEKGYNDIKKSDKSEQLNSAASISASDWVGHIINIIGLRELTQNSTILPQCISAYKRNIAGFGISIKYIEDEKETPEMKEEWNKMQRILDLLNMDSSTKEIFEKVVEGREKYGISYIEVIRDMEGNVAQIEYINDTETVDMTYPLEPYIDTEYIYKGESIHRKRKFKKYRQTVGGKTVYFKQFGDPRVMDSRTGKYIGTDEEVTEIGIDNQANEILEFKIGTMYYGEVRWIGQVLTLDGNRRAEILNNNYFREGRHIPLMIIVKGGKLSTDSFDKLNAYMDGIKGENGQHGFVILEAEKEETTTQFEDGSKVDVEIKDLGSILQKDELFQGYQDNGRRKTQSSFLLPDLYVGYTTDFNRATAQAAMEVTEKQVFQPERESLAWILNNVLLNAYGFKHVQAVFDEPDITNPDDLQKILNITERAGGMTMNDARDLTGKVLNKQVENYPDEIGNQSLQYMKGTSLNQTNDIAAQIEKQITKATADQASPEVVAIMKEVRRMLKNANGGD